MSRFDAAQIKLVQDQYKLFENDHKHVTVNTKTFFLSKYVDDNGDTVIEWASKKSKDDEWADRKVPAIVNIRGVDQIKMLNMTDLMLEGEHRTYGIAAAPRYKNVIFKPNMTTSMGYNLWTGFPVVPTKGNITPFVDFMKQIINDDDTVHAILNWFADMYQNPHLKPDWAIILRGDKGAGKNTIEEMLGRGLLDRSNYFRTSDTTKLFGRFNSHLATNLLLVGQEIVWSGKKEMDSTLKEMVTEKTRSLEKKGVDTITVDNYTRIYLTSNADWVVPASGKDERRYLVVNVTRSAHVDFNKLWDWYNSGGKEALMHEMLNRDLSHFNRHKAPSTKGLQEQLAHSLFGVERFVYEALMDGVFALRSEKVSAPIVDTSLRCKSTAMYKSYCSLNRDDRITQKEFGTKVKKLLGIKSTARVDGATAYQLPPISNAVVAFEKQTGITIEIDPDHDWQT
jgi:hypothetical protein